MHVGCDRYHFTNGLGAVTLQCIQAGGKTRRNTGQIINISYCVGGCGQGPANLRRSLFANGRGARQGQGRCSRRVVIHNDIPRLSRSHGQGNRLRRSQ